jgi:hypothetical protein
MPLFAATVFLSACLLFTVQPMVAKFLLPFFGGSAGVWTTCLVFFQILLLAGYLYAHVLRVTVGPVAQRFVHLGVLALGLLFLPPVPHVAAATHITGTPILELMRALLLSVGLPFFALSATAPLLMEWFRRLYPMRSPHLLYAFSNAGSLLALILYPALLEPLFNRGLQAKCWSWGMAVFIAVCAVVAWVSGRSGKVMRSPKAESMLLEPRRRESATWLWVALPACSSALLLALTNQICQDVAAMPLLWVAPLAVYLITFILCFESPRWYRRSIFIPACLLSFLFLAWLLNEGYLHQFRVQLSGYLAVLFAACMASHGELYRLRPEPEQLTGYYLAISLGGALGGILVALVAPAVFDTLFETPLVALALTFLLALILQRDGARLSLGSKSLRAGTAALSALLPIGIYFAFVIAEQRRESIYFARSFYGVYRVKEGSTLMLNKQHYPLSSGLARVLLSGQIYHGLQFLVPPASSVATTYYAEEGGLGLAWRELPAQTNRHIGAVGLGAGTLATYGRPGDSIQFYELSPDVARIAKTHFTFLSNSMAQLEVKLGDGRISLEQQSDQSFDLLVLDAFSGDSIPTHLLTVEAMGIHMRHLKSEGVIAIHISNNHVDLEPVVRALAERHQMTALRIASPPLDPRSGKLGSLWMLLSASPAFLKRPAVAALTSTPAAYFDRKPLLWTDDHSSILSLLH